IRSTPAVRSWSIPADGSSASSGEQPRAGAPRAPPLAHRPHMETGVREGPLTATRDAPVGGQAVLEGVMMRGVSTWAVAVRKPSPEQLKEGHRLEATEAALGEIEVVSEPLVSALKRHRWLRLPIVRGVAALVESLKIGFKALGISANAQLEAEETDVKMGGGAWAGTVVVSIVL